MLVKQSAHTSCICREFQRIVVALALSLLCVSAAYAEPDQELQAINASYKALLDAYVMPGNKNDRPANMVDYDAVRNDPRLPQLQALLKDYPKARLDTREKKIAFYLNAYNILAIAKVTQHWPIERLKSLGTYFKPVWTHPVGEVCGDEMTLRILEHDILRKLNEPRIHFALNCASMSCPDLRAEPYVVEKLEQQLQEQTQIFLTQDGKGLKIEGNQIKLSSIFDWFEEDFADHGGVMGFIRPYLPERDDWEIAGYLYYDWSVNDHLSGSELMKIKRNRGNTWFN